MKMLSKAVADLIVIAPRKLTLKPEQEVHVAVRNILTVLQTGYGKKLPNVYPLLRVSNEGQSNEYVIPPLVSIIKYEIQDIKSIGYSAVNIREFSVSRKFTSVTLKLCLLVLGKSRKRLLGSEFTATSEYLCCCSGRFVIADRILCSENY